MKNVSHNPNTDSVFLIHKTLMELLSGTFSDEHKRDIKACTEKFMIFLISKSLYNQPLTKITQELVEEFLSAFYTDNQKGKYYYNIYKRLNILFNHLLNQKYISENPLLNIAFDKKITDNIIKPKKYFENDSLSKIFEFLKLHDESIYLYAVINYYLMIKSSVIRKLTRGNFDKNFSILNIIDNNSQVSYNIPPELSKILKDLKIQSLNSNINIFTKSDNEFSQSTFFKKWARIQKELLNNNIIQHSDYEVESFCNTMVYEIYSKNGDIFEIQKLLKRSTTYKTKEYLKNLFGEEFDSIKQKGN